jgi:transcriptional regulator with XRE-family HTH domain
VRDLFTINNELNFEQKREIGKRLKMARENKKLSQQDMGDLLKTSYQNYARYEKGADIKSTLLIKFCAILECSPNWLLGIEDEGQHLPPESPLLQELKKAFELLNREGQKQAMTQVSILAGNPAYRISAKIGEDNSLPQAVNE